ncbi:hypothetical protein LLO_0940 [Legionella longbeachae NSW150]|uniref:Uncharacterized protein n=1 Tax=Legionella longbeachae serogroup 1 (strain NSW150) TaxID=661367 RepID=D3HQW8_LEGLN|nr:hypothetical protein [Legionella longbeachae]CBJ11288.1 hypothetical protein LLO_0940 [Legionella longbeachae NSW150]
MSKPPLKEYDQIQVGTSISAIVCSVYDDQNRCEVVYLSGNKAINEEVIWNGDSWQFAISGPCGGYADQISRLSSHVCRLRNLNNSQSF